MIPKAHLCGMDEGARRWLLKYANLNFWRVSAWYDLDDLIQDGIYCWWVVARRYPDVRKRSQRMSLFMRTYTNHIHALANKRTKNDPEACYLSELLIPSGEEFDNLVDDNGDLRSFVIDNASPDLRRCLLAVIDRPELLARPMRRHLDGRRETTTEWLCGFVGIDPSGKDLWQELRTMLVQS